MIQQCVYRLVFTILLLCSISMTFAAEIPNSNGPNRYLNAVRTFADNVLKYGRDTYGPKHTPLFVDGLNVHTHEPVKWISPKGERWILSNLASQQNLFRTLDALTTITGNPKYKQAAMDAIKYAFENLRSPNGLLYWGVAYAYDADGDKPCSTAYNHSLRYNFPYYELMWEVTQDGLKDYIKSFWGAHILDWSNLDMLRYGSLDEQIVGKGWKHEYKGGSVFSVGKGDCSLIAGSPLFYAAAMLSRFSGDKEPLIWCKRLVHRYVETRNPNTGIASFGYLANNNILTHQFSDIINSHNISFPNLFPSQPKVLCDPKTVRPMWAFQIRGWICVLLLGELLGPEGEDFKRWTLEELTAWGKSAYRKRDNAFIPMFTDGTSLEGYVLKEDGYYGAKGTVYRAWHPGLVDLWGYALTYRVTGNEFMWEMSRNIAAGNSFGDIGAIGNNKPELDTTTDCSDPYALLSFLELYRGTGNAEFLGMASRIADNILTHRFHKGFFVPSKDHIYTRFDALEHLSLLCLFTVIKSQFALIPTIWPNEAVFGWDYRQQDNVFDVEIIYTLTDSLEPLISLNEAAATGNLEQVKLRISEGADVNFRERPMWTPLHRAVMKGYKDIVTFLLTKGADVNARNSWPGGTPLHYAAEKGYTEIARLLIDNGAYVNAESAIDDRATPLQYAAYAGNKDIVELLLQKGATIANLHIASYMGDLEKAEAFINKGADINALDGHGYSPLHYAAQNGQREAAELLIAKGADVDVKNWPSQAPLAIAVRRGHKDIIELLLDKGANINAADNRGNAPIHNVAEAGSKDIVELLIANGADINTKNNQGQTPLDIAVAKNRKDVIDLLVERGAVPSSIHAAARFGLLAGVKALLKQGVDVNAQDDKGVTPLNYAAQEGHKEFAGLLIANGADINGKDKEGRTSLYYAFSKDGKDMMEFLITKGADVRLVPEKGYPLLIGASWFGYKDIAELLVAHGARFDVKDQYGWTAFRYAASRGNRELVEFFVAKGADVSSLYMAACVGDLARVESFVEEGADVDTKDEFGWTPLYWAASTGQEEVAEFLVVRGADIQAETNDGTMVIHTAAQFGEAKLVELLISNGADVNAKAKNGNTPLYSAASAGHRAVVELLIAKGANVNEKGGNGQTPLYRAVQGGHKDVAEVLIYKGADVNSKDSNGQTPLHSSVRQGNRDIAELLIASGADTHAKNRWNRTPLDIAVDRGHAEIVELLRKQGAKE